MAENLTGAEGGCWTVTTLSSTHRFDLDAMTVTRIPGSDAVPTINDQTRPLLEIVTCTVGARGHSLMTPDDRDSPFLEHYWHLSMQVTSIEPALPDGPLA